MSEHDEQVALFQWLRLLEGRHPELGLCFAIPNGAALAARSSKAKRFSLQATKLKAEGMKPGVPDLFLPVARKGYHGVFIEMKFGRNKPKEHQAVFLTRLQEQGYLTAVCWSAEEARDLICEYLEIEDMLVVI
jgi:hypothetical protein